MRPTIFLVTALVAVSTASPWGSRANKQCAAYCKETSKFNYNVGTVYSYEYTGETASRISGSSDEESRTHITAWADFEVVSSCELILRLKEVNLETSKPEDASQRTAAPGSVDFSSALEQHPLIFTFQDGQIEHLCPSADEPAWSLNIKRGILSALQNSMQDLAVSQQVYETDVVGHCETNYTVTSHSRNGVSVSRTKDLLACTGRNNQHISPIQSTPYSSASAIQSLPLLKSDIECQQTVRNQRLEKSVCTENHLFRPFSNGQSGASTRITQSLTYTRERRSDETPIDHKSRRTSLLFDGAHNKKTSIADLILIDNTLKMLSHESRNGASPQIPALFSRLVTSLRPLTYRQLSEIFAKHSNSNAKKYLMDAAPLIGTAASYGLMKDLIQEGSISEFETDMWLSSLAFQTKPTLDMIAVVTPMLAENTVHPKAMLSISAMIHAYCLNNPQCESEATIRQAVGHLEKSIGFDCSGDEKTVLIGLKALGNAGILFASAETLRNCYQEERNSMVIRLAAIEALRRVSCDIVDRSSLLNFYLDASRDSELRIAAYLAVMQCPSPQLLEEIKQSLIQEPVNQVGSFIWTHLTNLQETSSPSKQAIRQMLQSDFLRNKFNTDARKFSRNLEASTFSKELNVGGTVESNVIFSTQSYLPRSATLNLTLDLFGQSVNLVELGARVEGFEPLVESFFGPGGLYPDETIQQFLESMRAKRSAPIDQKSINQLSTVFDAKSYLADQPQGHVYLRVFGNELHSHLFKGPSGKQGARQSALSLLLQAARQKDVDFTKSVSMMDVAYVIPTTIGLPLSFSVNATATVNFRMGGTFQVGGPTDVRVIGHIKPSGTIEVNGVMSVDAWTFARSGVQIQNTLHTTSSLSGKAIIQGSQVVSVQLDAPEAASHVFSYDSRLFFLQNGQQVVIKPDNKRTAVSHKSCSPSELSRLLAVELCAEVDYWPKAASGPRGPLAGPSHAAIFLRKTDTHAAYQLDFQREGLRSLSLTMDTPNSQINRRVVAQLTADDISKTLRLYFLTPQRSAELIGKYEYNSLVKAADVLFNLDGKEVAAIKGSLRAELKGPSGRYEPSLVISQGGKETFNFQGFYSFVAAAKYGFDFQMKHLTVRPIRFTGDLSKDTDKYEMSVGLKSYLLDTTVTSTIRLLDNKLITAKSKIDYSVQENTSQNLEISTKYSRTLKGALKKTTLSGIIQSSQFPQYNGDINWEMQRSNDYLENNLRINSGRDQWELQQLYSIQLRDAKIRFSITCPQQKVDRLLFTSLKISESSLSSQSGLRLSPGRQWTTKLDLVHQNQPMRYGGQLELASPTVNRQLKAEISEQNKQWDLIVDYTKNKQKEISIAATYKNPSTGIKLEHSVDVKVRSWMADDIDASLVLSANPSSSLLSFNGQYGDRRATSTLEYERQSDFQHVVTAHLTRDDLSVFQSTFNVNIGERKSLSMDIRASRRITLDALLNPEDGVLTVQLFWDREVDLTRSFEFSSKLTSTSASAVLKCTSQPPVRVQVDYVDKKVVGVLEWRDKAVQLDMELEPGHINGRLITPVQGLELISFNGKLKSAQSLVDSQLTVDWQRDRFTASYGGKNAVGNVQGTFTFTSTYPSLESLGLEYQALSTQPQHRYGLLVHHADRKVELSADYHRKNHTFSKASVHMASPIRGYESLKLSLGHNQEAKGFKTDISLEGPFTSQATVTVLGRRNEFESMGSLDVTTTVSAFRASKVSYHLVKARLEKKLKVIGELNGQKVVADAIADLSDSKIRSNLRLSTPFSEDITAALSHSFQKRNLASDGHISWSGNKSVRVSVNGQLVSKEQFNLNVTASAPGWATTANLDHKKSPQKMSTLLDLELNGRRTKWDLNTKSFSPLLLETTLSLPYSGYEELKMNLEHRQEAKKTLTRLQVSNRDKAFDLEHMVDVEDSFNWANTLTVKTPFQGILASFDINSQQSWTTTGRFQHDSQVQINKNTMAVTLVADGSQAERTTAAGSFKSSWSDDFSFELHHTDNGQEFHPVLTIRTGDVKQQSIRLETFYRRNPKNPSISVDIASPMFPPIKLAATYNNLAPLQTAKLNLSWNSNRNIDWSLDWTLAIEQSVIKTRLTTPFVGYSNLGAEVSYDLAAPRKTALAFLKRADHVIQLEAFAVGQGSSYHSEVVFTSPFSEEMKAVAVVDVVNARASLRLEKGAKQINLQGILTVAASQTSFMASLDTPISGWRSARLEATVKSNKELQLDVEWDGSKLSASGSYSFGSGKGLVKGNLMTPFAVLSSGGVDAAYDVTGRTKTGTLKLAKNQDIIQASAQATLAGPAVKVSFNLKAPCCGVSQLDFSGSFDETIERKTGFVKLELNKEKYQLDGHLIRSNGTVELVLKSLTGHQGYEQVVLTGKYDLRSTIKTGMLSFNKNADRFHISGAGSLHSILRADGQVELSTPIDVIRSVRLDGRYDLENEDKTAVFSFTRNDAIARLTAGASLTGSMQGKVQYSLETPISGYETLRGEVNFDLDSQNKAIVLAGQAIKAQIEWNNQQFSIHSTTPIEGYELLNINGDLWLNEKELRSSLVLEKNENKMQFRFQGIFDPSEEVASFLFESPIPGVESLASRIKWSLNGSPKKVSLQAARNDLSVELDVGGEFSRDYSSLSIQSRSNIDNWHSASLSGAYDIRSSISGNLNLERNGERKTFAGQASLTSDTAKVSLETPFEGMRSLGLTGLLSGVVTNTSTARTAALRLEKEGVAQDYNLDLNFDANSAAVVIETPLKGYENMSAKLRFALNSPHKSFHLVFKKNHDQLDLSGSGLLRALSGEAEFKFASTLVGYQQLMIVCNYNFAKAKTVAVKLTLNNRTVEASATLDGFGLSAQLTSPFVGFERLIVHGDINLNAKSARLVVEHNHRQYEATGSLNGRELTVQVKTPVRAYETVDLNARLGTNQLFMGFSSPASGKILMEAEFSLEMKFARAVLTHGNIRYRNELVANVENHGRQGDLFLGIQLPYDGFRNITSTASYNLVEKTLLASVDTTRHRYETVARVTATDEAAQAVVHVQTPFTGFEEIDLSAGYDLTTKTVFLINERNGQSVVFAQGTATMSPASSNLSATIRAPSILADDIQLIFAYNVAPDFTYADAKVKFLTTEILFDGKRNDWTSAQTTISTTFEVFEKAQIMWDLEKKAGLVQFNDFKIALDGRAGSSWTSTGITTTLSAPFLGFHAVEVEWSGLSNKITSRVSYRSKQATQVEAALVINHSDRGESGNYELSFNTGRSDLKEIKLMGTWACGQGNQIKSIIMWADAKKIEVSFDGRISSLQSDAKITLTAPSIPSTTTEIKYDLQSIEKLVRFIYSIESAPAVRFNAVADLHSGKVDLEAATSTYRLTGKSNLSGRHKEILTTLESGQDISKLVITAEVQADKTEVLALFSSPINGVKAWQLKGDYDTTEGGLKTSAILSWAEHEQIHLAYRISPTQFTVVLMTPFTGFEKTQLQSTFSFEESKQMVDSTFLWRGRTISGKAVWEFSTDSGIIFSIRVATPFQGFEEVGLRGSFLSGNDYSTTLTYTRAGQAIDMQGKLSSNAEGSSARLAFTSADDFSAIVEYDFRLPKKTASLVVNQGSKRIKIFTAGEFNEKINGLLTVETTYSHPIRVSFDMDPKATEKNGRFTLEWGQQQKIELIGGLTVAKTGNKLRLTVQTPFDGFKKVVLNSKTNPKAFDVSLDYGRKIQLNGQYRWEASVYSLNGTLSSPWMENVSWQTYADLTAGFHGSSALKWAQKNFAFSLIHRRSGSIEAAVQTPYQVMSNAKLFAEYELGRVNKLVAARGEYNGLKASLEGRLHLNGLNTRTVTLGGSWNNQMMTVETLYRNEGGMKMVGVNITTPFVGLERWNARVECNRKGPERSYAVHFETPLATLPSIEGSVQIVLEAGKQLEISASGAALGYQMGAKFNAVRNSKFYVASLDLDMPFLKEVKSVNIRAECQLDGWKNVVTTVTAGVPAGEYTVKGSMLIGKSNLNLNAGIKTPSFAKSIEMGAGYNVASDLSLIQGEVFVWNNRLDGRYEKRGHDITAELSVSLPDVKLPHTRINVDMNYRSARQVQASVTVNMMQQSHTMAFSYHALAGTKFVGHLEVDGPLIHPKKVLSVKLNYGNLSALTYEGKFVDGRNVCELAGSLNLVGVSLQSQTKLSCSKMGAAEIDLTANPTEGQLKVTIGSTTHRLFYKLNRSDGYELILSAETPFFQPIHLRGTWFVANQQGQTSLSVRYGQLYHSVLADFLRSGNEKVSASLNVASPFLPGREASFQFNYHQLEVTAQVDFMGTSHRLTGQLEHWPSFSAQVRLDSPILPWKTVALYSNAVRHGLYGQANTTLVYGEQSLSLAGQLNFARWNNFEASLELNTPFQTLSVARANIHLNAVNSRRANTSISLQSSHPSLPRAAFTFQYDLNVAGLEASATLDTPFSRWENVGVVMKIPFKHQTKADGQITLILPKTRYSIAGQLVTGPRQLQSKMEISYGGRDFAIHLTCKADDVYQAKVDITTPIQGFEKYSWDVKGQANVKHWGEATAFLDWNGKRIEFNSNLRVEPRAYITVIQLSTPFVGFERYAVHLRLEGTERKTLQVEVESPDMRVGADFDYSFKSATDFISKASIRTPFVGYESFTLHLSNRLGDASYAASAEAQFANYGMAATVEGLLRSNGFQAQVDGRVNDKTVALKAAGSMDEKRISCDLNVVTPFEQLRNIESFIQLDKNLAESRGFGVNVNGRQVLLVSMSQQSDGVRTLQVYNPWRPVDVSFSWENSVDLIHYQAQFCWDLNQRSASTLGGRLIIKTSSYGRQLSLKTSTPGREISLDYAMELTSTKVDHSASVSWAPNRAIGYKILAENGSTRQRTQLRGLVRLDVPLRSFQLEARHVGGQEASQHVEFNWDVSRDPTKKMGFHTETRNGRQARLSVFHSALEHDIVLAGEYALVKNDLLGKLELTYSPLEEHRVVLEASNKHAGNTRSIDMSIRHLASSTYMHLLANKTSDGVETYLTGNLNYLDRNQRTQFLKLSARVHPVKKIFQFDGRTAENSLSLNNALTVSGSSYGIVSRVTVNDVDSLNVNGRLETSLLYPAMQMDARYAGGKSMNLYAGMPNLREVTLRASRDYHGRQITDGHFQLKLNRTDLLTSRLYWRSASRVELREMFVNGLVNVLATCESLANQLSSLAVGEWNDKRNAVLPTARLISQRLTSNFEREINVMRSEFQQLASEWMVMYEKNDFYLQNIVAAAQQLTSSAQPYINRAIKNIQAITSALIGEGTAFYKAMSSTYNTLYQAGSSVYQQTISYMSQTASEAARHYNQLAGEVIGRLVQCEAALAQKLQLLQSLYSEYSGRLEAIVMEQVEDVRRQFIELGRSYVESFQPYVRYFDSWIEKSRAFTETVVRSMQDGHRIVHEQLMAYGPFQRIYEVYLQYATWLEEFHLQDYVDECVAYVNQLKQEITDRFNAMTARYKPLIEPVIQAVRGQVDALKQMPVFAYLDKVVERTFLQVQEFYKYIELETELREILRQILRHTDQLSNQLVGDLKGSFDFPWRPQVVQDWELGRFEYTQKLPFTWEDFSQAPRLRELPLIRKMVTAKRNFLRDMDYSQFYFSAMNALATYKPMRIQTVLPPFGSHAFVAGTQHYMTFDQRFYEFAGECSYLLVSDFFRNDFSAVVNYEGANSKVTRKSITILSDGRQIEIDSSFRVTVNGRKIEMPLIYEGTAIHRDGQRVLVNTEKGYKVDCNLYRDICSVHIPGWSFGKTGGLFGVYNNEPADDFLTPFRQQRSEDEVDSFANSWKVGTARCRVRNFALTRPVVSQRNSQLCDKIFNDEKSVLRPCYQMVDPTPFKRMCLNDLAALENSPKKELGVCTAAAAYVNECRFAGLDLFVPPQCVRCELEDGRVIGSGEIKTFQNNAPRSADVVFIVEQKRCLNGTRLSSLPTAIDAALKEKGIQNNRFAVVGYGGPGQLLSRPHIRTAEGQIWANRKSIQAALEDLPLHDGGSNVQGSDIPAALRYAVNLPYRVGVSKQFVLVSCNGNECQASSYADTLTLLIENDIKLHLLQPRDFVVKGRNNTDEAKNVFGFDAEEVFTVRNIRSLKGDRELRRQLAIPKDFCTPLALETNGTLFDLKKMMPGQQQQQTKKFVDVFARRVAATGEPSPCQRCDCIGDRDGIGSVLCQRCVSPVLERLDKVWEQLIYDNDLENHSVIETEIKVPKVEAQDSKSNNSSVKA